MKNAELRNQGSKTGYRIVRLFNFKIHHVPAGTLRPSFCIPHSAFCLSSCTGQAMVEFTVALVAILAVAIGAILLNRMQLARIASMAQARAEAGAMAMDSVYHIPMGAQFISDWEPGADAARYTGDDEPLPDGTAIAMIDNITATADLDAFAAPTNAITRLQSSVDIGDFYLVQGSDSEEIALHEIPGVMRLFTREHSVSVESEAWLVWSGGIY